MPVLRFLATLLVLPCLAVASLAQGTGGPAATIPPRGFMEPAGPVAAAQLSHFGTITMLMLIVVVPVFLIVPFILFRYRLGARGSYKPDWDFNWGIEAVIWGLPIFIVILLSSALWSHTLKYDPYTPLGENPLKIEVVSLDWKFLFLYPEQGIATVDLLAIPENRPVTLTLTSATVMQSFMVPRLAGQIYTMAGMSTKLNLMADKPGRYIGRNTQYNGIGFATQSFRTEVMTDEAFAAWVETARATSDTLDWQGYQALLKPSIVEEPVLYSSFEPNLFNKVIASFAPDRHGMANASIDQHDNHGTAETNQ